MPPRDRKAVAQALTDIFHLERQADELRLAVAQAPEGPALDAIGDAIAAAPGKDEVSRILELTSIASILSHMKGPRVVDLLIDVLASESPEARHAAGTALEEVAFEHWKEAALGVERALSRLPAASPALRELPYVLVEVPEPGVVKLMQKFLAHAEAEVVAAAIEACVEIGDPATLKMIAPLESDPRTLEVENEEDDDESPALVTLGELAREAKTLLESAEDEPEIDRDRRGRGHEHAPSAPDAPHAPSAPDAPHAPHAPHARGPKGGGRR
jgi:HEAT repeat protein